MISKLGLKMRKRRTNTQLLMLILCHILRIKTKLSIHNNVSLRPLIFYGEN